MKFAVPKATTNVSVELRSGTASGGAANQTYEYKSAEKQVMWLIKKFNGLTEHICKARISFSQESPANIRKAIGPISMNFEIPMYATHVPQLLAHHTPHRRYIVSGLNIRFLRIEERSKSYNPSRWVRNITQANSYICRVN